jgi:hypothetical protein
MSAAGLRNVAMDSELSRPLPSTEPDDEGYHGWFKNTSKD